MSSNDHTPATLSPPEAPTVRGSITSIEKEDIMSTSPTVADLPALNSDKKSISESQTTHTPGDQPDTNLEKALEGAQPPKSNVLSEMGAARKHVLMFGFVSTAVHASWTLLTPVPRYVH